MRKVHWGFKPDATKEGSDHITCAQRAERAGRIARPKVITHDPAKVTCAACKKLFWNQMAMATHMSFKEACERCEGGYCPEHGQAGINDARAHREG